MEKVKWKMWRKQEKWASEGRQFKQKYLKFLAYLLRIQVKNQI